MSSLGTDVPHFSFPCLHDYRCSWSPVNNKKGTPWCVGRALGFSLSLSPSLSLSLCCAIPCHYARARNGRLEYQRHSANAEPPSFFEPTGLPNWTRTDLNNILGCQAVNATRACFRIGRWDLSGDHGLQPQAARWADNPCKSLQLP